MGLAAVWKLASPAVQVAQEKAKISRLEDELSEARKANLAKDERVRTLETLLFYKETLTNEAIQQAEMADWADDPHNPEWFRLFEQSIDPGSGCVGGICTD